MTALVEANKMEKLFVHYYSPRLLARMTNTQTVAEIVSAIPPEGKKRMLLALKDTERTNPTYEFHGQLARFPGLAASERLVFVNEEGIWYFTFEMAVPLDHGDKH